MAEYNTQFIPIYTIGYQIYDVPVDVFSALKEETSEMVQTNFKNNQPYNSILAGNIENEFRLEKTTELLDSYISVAAPVYWNNYQSNLKTRRHQIKREPESKKPDIWVNFQRKGEVNPIHNHSGLLSFVIYVDLPYTLEEEKKFDSVKNSNNPVSGTLHFVFVDQYIVGGVSTYALNTDKNFEGKMIIFSSKLQHIVYPFYTSDKFRITVAGNIELKDE